MGKDAAGREGFQQREDFRKPIMFTVHRVLNTTLKGTTMRQIFPALGFLFLSVLPGHSEDDVKIIDSVQADRLLQSGAVFIDNRPESKFSIGHIEGAINLPFFAENDPSNKMTRENLASAIGDKRIVVFYCSGMERAFHAIKQAERWGISAEKYWYKSGYEEWKTLGKTVAN